MCKIIKGERPQRPAEATVTDDLWELIQSAWAQEPQSRPPVEAIIASLLRAG